MSAVQLPFPAAPAAAFHWWNGQGEVLEHLEGYTFQDLCPECTTALGYVRSEVSGRQFLQCPKCGCRVRWGQIIHFDETLKRWAAA